MGRTLAVERALGQDFKGKVSIAFYFLAVGLAFVAPTFAALIYVGVALMWIIPDRLSGANLKGAVTNGFSSPVISVYGLVLRFKHQAIRSAHSQTKGDKMKIEKVLYRGKARSTGGRDGQTTTENKDVDAKLTTPKELGGGGGAGTNPEQLFAAGYSACFIGAMKFVAMQQKAKLPDDLAISGIVGIGQIPGGFGIEVELQISAPGMDKKVLSDIVEKAHGVCPYSNATRGNTEVKLTLV